MLLVGLANRASGNRLKGCLCTVRQQRGHLEPIVSHDIEMRVKCCSQGVYGVQSLLVFNRALDVGKDVMSSL